MQNREYPIVEHVDEERREFLEKLVKTSVFTVPLVIGVDVLLTRKLYALPESSSTTSSASSPGGGSSSTPASSSGGSAVSTTSGASSSGSGGYFPPPPPPGGGGGGVSIPEPATLTLLGLGIAAMELLRRSRAGKDPDESS